MNGVTVWCVVRGVKPSAGAVFDMVAADRSLKSGIALEKTYQCLLCLIPAVEKFPRSQKFRLGGWSKARRAVPT